MCEDFVDRVEKTIRSDLIPEQRFTIKVMDNSADDPVQGYVCDVTYCLEIPMVGKQEQADEDDDLKIVGVMLATKNIVLDVVKVKTEEKTPPSSPQKGAGSEQQKSTPPTRTPCRKH